MGQRDRQPALRHRRLRERHGLYLGGERHEFRLTPWYNDPVSDTSGEAFYLRDEETGHFWSPTPLPRRGAEPYVTRHGFGYSVFEHTEDGIVTELWIYVATDAPVKFAVLKLAQRSGRRAPALGHRLLWSGCWAICGRRRSCTWSPSRPGSGALFARNAYNTEFAGRVAFFDVSETARTRHRRPHASSSAATARSASPAAMTRARLSGQVGAGLDPCAAMQVPFDLRRRAGARDRLHARRRPATPTRRGNWSHRFRGAGRRTRRARRRVAVLEAHAGRGPRAKRPTPSLNLLANGWLLYQTLACRIWARSGFYQSGGAFGFRDQLQDAMALVHAEPRLLREHLLLLRGPPVPRGRRAALVASARGPRRAHALLRRLPLAAAGDVPLRRRHRRYRRARRDACRFLEGRPVNAEEDSYYDLPQRSDESATLYEHCVRAIEHGLRFGEHGLPLMGCGDWNDGMNLVGQHGKGESVWLASSCTTC